MVVITRKAVYYDNMDSMTDEIRKAVKVHLLRSGIQQKDIAQATGFSQSQISNALNGWGGNVPRVWSAIFEQAGLRLAVLDKDGKEVR